MGQSASTAEMPEAQEGQHTISLAATEIIRVAGMSGYHTSVIVDDQEYFFDSIGILEAKPLFSHMLPEPPEPDIDATGLDLPPSRHPSGPLRSPSREPVVTRIGSSAYSGRDLVAALHQYFERGTYDVFYKNCNTFTDAALYFLTKTRMPAYCNRIERLVTATDPVSVSLLNRIFKAMVEHQQGVEVEGDIYVPNPLSAGFSVEKLIRKLEGESETESSGSDSEESEDEPPSLARRLSELPSKLVDKYVQKVLAETPADVEEVIIEKDGSYRIVEEEQEEGASIKEKAKKDAEKPGEEGDEKTSGDGQDGLKRKGTDDGIEVPLSKRQRRRQKILEARGGLPHHEEAPAAETVTTEPDAPATV
ncbi:DeSI-like protein sdu1 (Meiotically up-regulated gene 67 protein) [Durusdinium trenchii]